MFRIDIRINNNPWNELTTSDLDIFNVAMPRLNDAIVMPAYSISGHVLEFRVTRIHENADSKNF